MARPFLLKEQNALFHSSNAPALLHPLMTSFGKKPEKYLSDPFKFLPLSNTLPFGSTKEATVE